MGWVVINVKKTQIGLKYLFRWPVFLYNDAPTVSKDAQTSFLLYHYLNLSSLSSELMSDNVKHTSCKLYAFLPSYLLDKSSDAVYWF